MMKDERPEVLKWRWEFMRRNREYISDYKKMQARRKEIDYDRLQEQIKKDRFQWGKDHPTNLDNMADVMAAHDKSEEWLRTKRKKELEIIESYQQEESVLAKKWFPGCSWYLHDPSKSFEEIIEIVNSDKPFNGMDDVKKYAKKGLLKWSFGKALDNQAVTVLRTIDMGNIRGFTNLDFDNLTRDDLLLRINVRKVNSLTALKETVCELLEEKFKKKPRKYESDYDVIIKAGDLKEKGKMTNQAIAKIINPRAFKGTEDNPANPESAIRMISYYYKRYNELINGGYKDLTYP